MLSVKIANTQDIVRMLALAFSLKLSLTAIISLGCLLSSALLLFAGGICFYCFLLDANFCTYVNVSPLHIVFNSFLLHTTVLPCSARLVFVLSWCDACLVVLSCF